MFFGHLNPKLVAVTNHCRRRSGTNVRLSVEELIKLRVGFSLLLLFFSNALRFGNRSVSVRARWT